AGEERLQIHAAGEVAAGAGEHEHRHVLALVELVERGGDTLRHGRVDRVARLRPVDGDDGDRAVDLDLNLVSHLSSLACTWSLGTARRRGRCADGPAAGTFRTDDARPARRRHLGWNRMPPSK